MQVCRICLATDRKMYGLDSGCTHSYERITGLTCLPDDLLPKYVCWECAYYMSKYDAFKSKAVTSQHVLQEILSRDGLITDNTVKGAVQYQSTLIRTNVLYLNVTDEEVKNHEYIDPNIKSEPGNENHFDSLNGHFSNDIIGEIKDYHNEILVGDDILANATKGINNIDESVDLNKGGISIAEYYNECGIDLFEDTEDFHDYDKSAIQKTNNKRRRKSRVYEVDADTDSTDLTEETKNIGRPTNQPIVNKKRKKKESKIVKDSKKTTKEITKKNLNVSIKEKRAKSAISKEYNKIDTAILTLSKLSNEEQFTEMEKRKENVFYIDAKFKCTDCHKGFSDEEKHRRHMEKHSDSNGAYECKLCKLRYTAQCKLNLHMRTHMYKITCLQCKFSTVTLTAAIKHQNHHKGKQLICPHCNEVYTHRSSYLSHLRIKHPSNVICQYCGHSFINDRGLLLHKKYVHRFDEQPIPEDGPYCETCDIRFLSPNALDTHKQMSDKHPEERNSEKKQNKKNPIRRSKPTSEPFTDGPKPCEQCEEKLPNPRAYFEHFRKEHKDKNRTLFYTKRSVRYMCEVCGQMMPNAAHLRDHQFAHSEVKQFKCEGCGRLFQQKAHLKIHQRHHCGTKVTCPCNICGKVFSNRSNLRRHTISHSGVRAFKCEMCDKTFAHLGNKKAHVDFVHKKKPWPKRNRGTRKRTEKQLQPEMIQQNPCNEADMQQEWNNTS